MGTKLNPGKFDCYANAEADEPMFVLLGRDKHAPTLVWLWAALRELDGEEVAKVSEARQCCLAMIEYAAKKGKAAVGLGQSALGAVLELIRCANYGVKQAGNAPTTDEELRRFLGQTSFEAKNDGR